MYDLSTDKGGQINFSVISHGPNKAFLVHVDRWQQYHVHCEKLYNLFVGALETGRKAGLWRSFLACFAANTN
jgi:hypothetical protein